MPKKQVIEVPHPKPQTFDALLRALPSIGMKIKEADPATGHIDASTGISLASWGEKIRVDVTDGANGSLVNVSSGNKAQLISWGKNNKNIDQIEQALHQALGPGGPPPHSA